MKFYHGTKHNTWKVIQKDGKLWGYPKKLAAYPEFFQILMINSGKCPDEFRETYLATTIKYALENSSGEVILEVEYEPSGNFDVDSYDPQKPDAPIRVSVPIPLSKIKIIDSEKFRGKTKEGNEK